MEFMFFGYEVAAWQTFATFGVTFMLLEVFVPGFVLLPIGVAALLTVPVAYYVDEWLTQLSFFGLSLIVVFTFFVKVVRPRLTKENYNTNVDSMVGRVVEVTETIVAGGTGYVKLYGDRWQAYSSHDGEFAKGEKVKIVEIDGNKVVVEKI